MIDPAPVSFKKQLVFSRCRLWTVVSLLFIVPIGFYSKFYTGPAAYWVNDSLGGLFYEIFWCLIIFLFAATAKTWKIAAFVFIVTCFLEFLQFWHAPFLELLRSNFFGATILGTSFIWTDMPYYLLGSSIGWLWMSRLQRIGKERSETLAFHDRQ